jgi:hypothetical protein
MHTQCTTANNNEETRLRNQYLGVDACSVTRLQIIRTRPADCRSSMVRTQSQAVHGEVRTQATYHVG